MNESEMHARLEENYRKAEALAKRDIERHERLDAARERALKILETGDPCGFILDTFKTQHIGDNETAEGILIGTANQSIENSKGIQPAVYGESGTGKSHAARAMLHLFPDRYYMMAALSDKALFYLDADELRPGMTIFSDDVKISEGIEGVIKRATTSFQEPTINKVPTKEGGKWKTKDLKIPPRIDWLLTSVDSQGSEQLINRQIGFGVDESPEQDEKVTAFELEKARAGKPEFDVTDDVLICREIILNIKEDETGAQRLFTVKIPFANRIEWLDKKNRRNLPIFLDMIKGYAALNFKQRETINGAVIATEDDFKAAERLYNTRGGFQKLHIHEREKEMLQYIVDNSGELTTDDLMSKLNLSGVRVRQIATRLETVLPGFKVELRSENVKSESDVNKSTITRINYYCYSGAVTVDLFGSVVSLRDDTEDTEDNSGINNDHFNSTLIADNYRFNNHFNQSEIPLENAQNGGLTQKQGNNNKINNNNNNNKGSLKGNLEEHTCIFSPGDSLSAPESDQTEADNNAILPLGDADPSEPTLKEGVKGTLNGVKVVEADLNRYVFDALTHLSNGNAATFDPAILCNETVAQYCTDRGITKDRQTALILAQRFSELVNGTDEVASIFLKLTGGKPLILGDKDA